MHASLPRRSPPAGITLLEVLLAIGILSIGLLSVLALLPAGRTFVVQAERDDRAAAIIPDALATMEALGLFAENSLEWYLVKTVYDAQIQAPAELPAERPEWHILPANRDWAKVNPDRRRAQRTHHYGSRDLTVDVSGEIPVDEAGPVTLTINRNGQAFDSRVIHDIKQGFWKIGLTFAHPEGDRS
ncbi:MAG: prepilin-type N-terminal cleavage/methylation domain-containing protein, partial [Planctomycetia bacterium]